MEQILVTVDSNQPLQNIRKAINMLRGVVSTTVVKEPIMMLYQFHKSDIHQGISDALLYWIFLVRSP